MSVKVFNTVTNQWEQVSTTVATGIKVVDLENHFAADNVNDCLIETANALDTLSGRVEFIYENGTIGGGGGGGGGSVLPTVTIDGETTRNVKSDEVIDLFYFFTSPNIGDGNASISYGAISSLVPVKQGRNKQTIGPFARGSYTVTIMVQDSQGFWSAPLRITVISGSLELASTFNDSVDFTLLNTITIPYTVTTLMSENVFLDYWVDNVKFTAPAQIGANNLVFGNLQHMGPTFLRMQVRNTTYVSNILSYILVASDSTTLFLIPVSYQDNSKGVVNSITVGTNLVLDYRVSMKNQFSFNTVLYVGVNGQDRFANVTSKPGVNFWNIGVAGSGNLSIGPHVFRIVTSTTDGLATATIQFSFNVTATDYVPYSHVTTNLVAQFDATGKLNSSVNRDVWLDTSDNHHAGNLIDFNYTTNGWNNNALDVSGKSYAVINFAPFAAGIKNGFTCEVVFKTKCAGDVDAKVISCRNPVTPFQGFEIDTSQATFSSGSDTVLSQIQEDTWTKASFVVQRGSTVAGRPHTMLLYINGIISSVAYLTPNDPNAENYSDGYSYGGLIYIGCGLDASNNIIHNSLSSVQSIRVYDRALSDLEIVKNYIADIPDPEAQMAARKLNAMTDSGTFDPLLPAFPRLDINCNIEGMDENTERLINQMSYADPADPSKNFLLDFAQAFISWQGTSSKTYPTKNWTLRMSNQGNAWLYTPRDEWLPDLRWTLKANYMDSSNASNVGLNKFIRDYLKQNTAAYPSEILDTTGKVRPNIDGFPLYVTINGQFMGVYCWNIDRFGLQNNGFVTYTQVAGQPPVETRKPNMYSYEILANTSEGAGAFKLPTLRSDPNHYAVNWAAIKGEFRCRYAQDPNYNVTELIQGVATSVLAQGKHDKLLALVEWVNDADDAEFFSQVSKHWSLDHLVDYYLIAFVFGMVDNLGKNMVISTFGTTSDDVWYPSFYDCDSTLGLNNSGFTMAAGAGVDTFSGDYNTSESKLWTKLLRNFGTRVSSRYQQMRLSRNVSGTILPPWFSYESASNYLDGQFMSKIGAMIYNLDARVKYLPTVQPQGEVVDPDWFNLFYAIWSYICKGSRLQFTQRWLKERFVYLDSVFEFAYTSKMVIRSNKQGVVTLSIKTYSPEWVKISFTDAADAKIRMQVNKNGFTDFTYNITNATDNNIEIYAANNIMYIEGIKDLNAGSIDISQAAKLISLDISGSPRISQLSLGSNTYLQSLLCNDCTNLGFQVSERTLDISQCTNLRAVNVSNTHIQNVRFNDVGGVIESLDASRTDITSFQLIGQDYLTNISLGQCRDLSTLTISDCGGLQTLLMPDTNLASVSIVGCASLATLDISRTRNLKTFDISGTPNLRNLTMSGVSNLALTEVDLSYAPLLESFDMSATGYIQFVALPSFPAIHTIEKVEVTTGIAILNKKNVNLASVVVRLTDIGDPILGSDFATAILPGTGYTRITLIPSVRIPADQRFIYVTYTNNCCLSTLKCNGSAITSLKFGRNTSYPVRVSDQKYALDLSGVPVTVVNFSGCGNLVEIRNISYTAAGSSAPFTSCINLKTITGTITLTGDITDGFRDCTNLAFTGFTLNLTTVTWMWQTFWNCKAMTMVNVNTILQACGPSLQNLTRTFLSCSAIVGTLFQTYPNLFNKCTNLLNAQECFNGCGGITGTLPAALLQPLTKFNNANFMFAGTNISGAIPTGFFDANVTLTSCAGIFQSTKINNLTTPQGFLLRNNAALTDVSSMFLNCSQLQLQIDSNLFIANPNLVNVSQFFQNCPLVFGSIPANLFNAIPTSGTPATNNIQYMNYFFSGSGVSGSIPPGMLDNSRNLLQVEGLFNSCTQLSGEIPPDLFLNNTKVAKIGVVFQSCAGLTGPIPPNILRNKPQLATAQNLFYGCSGLDSTIPQDFFNDNPGLTDISSIFSGCSNLHGAIPARESTWTSTETFDLIARVVLSLNTPDLTQLVVKPDAGSPALIRDQDYKVAIVNNNVITITLPTLLPSTLFIGLPYAESMAVGVTTISNVGLDQASLVVKNFAGVAYVLTTDYTLSTVGSNLLISRTSGGAIPSDTATIYVAYNRTVAVDQVATLNTYNINTITPSTVRPTITNVSDNITTQNLNTTGTATANSTIEINSLSGASTCVVQVGGIHTGILTPQTTVNGTTWANITTNTLKNLNTNLMSSNIASTVNGVYEFPCSGKVGVRLSAGAMTGTAIITMYANSVNAVNNTDYTLAINTIGYAELTRKTSSVAISSGQSLVVTYTHTDPTMSDRLDIINRSTRPSLLGQTETVTNWGLLDKLVNLTTANYVFWQCWHPQFNSSIPPKLFINGNKITSITGFFGYCWYLSGWLPASLLANCPSVTAMSWMFTECVKLKDPSSTYAIPPGFFDKCPNLTTLRSFFQTRSGFILRPGNPVLAGTLDKDLFKFNTKLTDISFMFDGCSLPNGGLLDSDLFRFNTALTTISQVFWGSSGITALGPNLFRTCTAITDMSYAFKGCTGIVGYVPTYWASDHPLKSVTTKLGCFQGDTQVINWNLALNDPLRIPDTWR